MIEYMQRCVRDGMSLIPFVGDMYCLWPENRIGVRLCHNNDNYWIALLGYDDFDCIKDMPNHDAARYFMCRLPSVIDWGWIYGTGFKFI